MRHLFILTSLFIFITTQSQAASYIWNGDGDGISWADPDNWDLNAVPSINDDVRIENIADDVTVDGGSYGAKSIYLAGSLAVNAGDDLTVNKSLSSGIEMIGFAKLIIDGQLVILDSANEGILSDDDASITVTNMGELIISENGEDGIKKGILVNNNNVIIEGINDLSTAGLNCTTINNGTINIDKFGVGIIHSLSNFTTNNSILNIEDCFTGINGKFTNNGIINMKNIIGGDGIRLNSTLATVKNFGNINFEDVTYLITGYFGASFNNEAGGTITSTSPTNVNTVSAINFADEFDFTNNGTINLNGNIGRVVEMEFDPIYTTCDCPFINSGAINVEEASTGWNFQNNGSLNNTTGASITMDIEQDYSFQLNNSDLQNSGTITTNLLTSDDDDHIRLLAGATFSNDLNGTIILTGGREGIRSSGLGNTSTNNGALTISETENGIYLTSTNSFINLAQGDIHIYNFTGIGIEGSINNTGSLLINGGSTVFSRGILGNMVNLGTIDILNLENGGISSGFFTNSGTINTTGLSAIPIKCTGPASNTGTINITNCEGSGIFLSTNHTFTNSGNINNSGMASSTAIFTLSEASFINESTGNIDINGTAISSIVSYDNSTFVNHGIIDIENSTLRGIRTAHNAAFTNETNGEISITNTPTGIRSDESSIVTNKGMITINAFGENIGIHLIESSTVNNNNSGILNISNANTHGIFVDDTSKFNNDGTLNLEDNQRAITNSSKINNDGTLTIKGHSVYGIDNMSSSSLFNNNNTIEFMKSSNAKDIRNVDGAILRNDGTITAKM